MAAKSNWEKQAYPLCTWMEYITSKRITKFSHQFYLIQGFSPRPTQMMKKQCLQRNDQFNSRKTCDCTVKSHCRLLNLTFSKWNQYTKQGHWNKVTATHLSNKHLTTPKHAAPTYITCIVWVINSFKPCKYHGLGFLQYESNSYNSTQASSLVEIYDDVGLDIHQDCYFILFLYMQL